MELDTLVQNAGLTAWIALGPTVNGSDIGWSRSWFEWQTDCDAATWFATTGAQEIHADPNNYWVGVFTLSYPTANRLTGSALQWMGRRTAPIRLL